MKLQIIAIAFLFCSPTWSAPVQIKLQNVVDRVSKENYNVYENALKVYQAKTNIEKARAELLPKLNLWQVVSSAFNPASLFDQVTDVAPFLVPGNWFRLEEVKLLYLAEKEGYRALWGNELYTAKAMYAHILLDQQLYAHIQRSIKELTEIYHIIKTREIFGGVSPGTAREVEIKILGLKEDEKNLQVLLFQEGSELSYILGYSADTDLILAPLPDIVFEELRPLKSQDYEFRVLSASPERRQFEHFLSVIPKIKKEIDYAFLGVSEVSRGAAGGIFDALPIPVGMGFGKQSAIKIVDAQKEILKTQKKGIEETLKRQLGNTIVLHNSDIENYENFKRRVELATQSKNAILKRIQLGENLNILLLSESSRNLIQAESALLTIQHRFFTSLDKLDRLLFVKDYEKPAPLVEELRK